MANRSIFALCVLTTFGISQAAFAESHVGGETQPDTGAMSNMTMGDGAAQTGMMSGDMMSMMQNMMKMHNLFCYARTLIFYSKLKPVWILFCRPCSARR